MEYVKMVADLLKIRIAMAVVLSTAVAYIVAKHALDAKLIQTSLGVLLLAFGSGAFNHLQEAGRDALMSRTNTRPVPTGKISRPIVALLATSLVFAGFVVLFLFAGTLPAILGLITLLWYNAIYTPLKIRTPFSLLVGAVVGVFPPVIGFTAAGGGMYETPLMVIAIFFFIWQVPHFLLLLLKYGDDYLRAGFNTLNRYLPERFLTMLAYLWIFALAVFASLFPLFGLINRPLSIAVLLMAASALVVLAVPLLNPPALDRHIPRMFRYINLFMLLVSHLVMFDNLR